ncbi:MAG TPA: SgcJ/EcaC family oxidoreductase [Gemmataceae bacterium]|jgi:uncharacterized protein (TIGR02246 family)
MKTKATIGVTCGLLALLAGGAWVRGVGQPPKSETPPGRAAAADQDRPADRAAVREATRQFARAFEKGDANAVAALFTETGEYHDGDDSTVRGRAALAKAYAEFFAKRADLKLESKSNAIRFVGQDTAVEEGTFTAKAKDQPTRSCRYSALLVRQDGKWLMALLKEWGDDETERASLNDIAWLIGTWESTGGDTTARTTYEWAPNKKFIVASYTITPKGEQPTAGRQVLGVDPASGNIRSWTFDADGGIGEATWTWDDGRWAIDSDATLADGSDSTALNFLTKTGPDAFTWKSVKRTIEGDDLPDVGPVTVKRVAGGK